MPIPHLYTLRMASFSPSACPSGTFRAASLGLGFTGLLLLCGCQHTPTPAVHAVPVSSRAPQLWVASAPAPLVASVAQVQSQPLYSQAQTACRQKQYRKAVDLLQKLAATPGLPTDQIAFCHTQIDLVRKDAGLPAHYSKTLTAKSSPTLRHAASVQNADCGPMALHLLCQTLGVKTDVATLHKLAGTEDKTGSTLEGLAQACQKLKLKSEGVQVSREELSHLSVPAIAWVHNNHYIALLKLVGSGETGTATIQDPNQAGEETISQEKLLRMSGGYFLLVHH